MDINVLVALILIAGIAFSVGFKVGSKQAGKVSVTQNCSPKGETE